MAKDNVDIKAFLLDIRKLKRDLIPDAVVRGFRKTAWRARNKAVARTEQVFTLRNDYITRAIMFLPDKPNQIKAAKKAYMSKYKDFNASVFLRASSSPSKSLDFMVLHETGMPKTPHKGNEKLAVPARDLKKYEYENKGRTITRWKPHELLRYYNTHGPSTKGSKKHGKKRRGKPKAFILKSNKGHGTMIARRKSNTSRKLEILYRFLDTADIKKQWKFVDTIKNEAYRFIRSDVINRLQRIKRV